MKNKEETISITEDQTYLEGINLVTGLKINYNRIAITPSQLNAMCINENLSKGQKALKILKKGQNMQRWSILQHLNIYLQSNQSYQDVCQTIWKYFQDFGCMMGVLAQGIQKCLSKLILQHQQTKDIKVKLSKKTYELMFKIIYRGLTDQKYNMIGFQDLSCLFNSFFCYIEIFDSRLKNDFIQQCKGYINNSFAMNALPQKRKIAFEMMKCLIQHSEKIYNQAKSKALFFNNDQNPFTRRAICQLMAKILVKKPCEQIRKCIIQYFYDTHPSVRQAAFECLISIQHQKHVDAILKCLKQQNQQIQYECVANIKKISQNVNEILSQYQKIVLKNQKYQQIIVKFCNKVFTQENQELQTQVIQNLQHFLQLVCMQNKNYEEVFLFEKVNFQKEEICKSLIKLYNKASSKQLKNYLYPFLLKSIKFNKQIFFYDPYFLQFYLGYLKNGSEQSNYLHSIYLLKSIEENKWRQTQIILKSMLKLQLNQMNYQKISLTLSKLILFCPNNLIELSCKTIVRLMVTKRKNMQLFSSLKQKLMNSKCWMHRRNYIILYSEIKQGASFQYQRLIPILNYKFIAKDKIEGLRFQFVKHALKIYTNIDPVSYIEKNTIKDTLFALMQDQNTQISEKSAYILAQIQKLDLDLETTQKNLKRNNRLIQQEQKMKEKQILLKKSVKTERDLGKKQIKVKSRVIQNRTSLNVSVQPLRPGTGISKITNITQTGNITINKQYNKLVRSGSGVVRVEPKKYDAFKKDNSKK